MKRREFLKGFAVSALAWWSAGTQALPGGGFTLACLGTLPVFTGGGLTLQEAVAGAGNASVPLSRLTAMGVALAVVALVFTRPRRTLATRRSCLSGRTRQTSASSHAAQVYAQLRACSCVRKES